MKLKLFIFALITLFSVNLFAQNKIITTSGETFDDVNELYSREVQPIDKKLLREKAKKYFEENNSVTDLDLILFYEVAIDDGINFGFFGQDWIVQWFEAPADMIIRKFGINCYDVETEGTEIEMKLVKLNWTKEQLLNAGEKNWGYYEAEGNGFNDITAFLDNPDRTGDWVDVEGSGMPPIFKEDLWSDAGVGAVKTPLPSGAANAWQWVENITGWDISVSQGEIIGVAVKNLSDNFDADRIGLWALGASGYPGGFKFYANGRLTPGGPGVGDCGWWSRNYTFDFALDVTITGYAPPEFSDITEFGTTLDNSPKDVYATITNNNPSGGESGVESAELHYRFNDDDWNVTEMTNTENDIYKGTIPEQQVGYTYYYISATDINGNYSESRVYSFMVGGLYNRNNLLIFNGADYQGGFPFDYYLGPNCRNQEPFGSYLDLDIWSYGQVPAELLENYQNVFEICVNDPTDYNNDPVAGAGIGGETIRNWLDGDPNRNYFLAGQEWLGAWNDFTDIDFQAGDFAYDILGISHSYNDVSFDGSYCELKPSILFLKDSPTANQGLVNARAEDLQFDPKHELNIGNWMDAFEINSKSATVLMEVETRGIEGQPAVEIKPCAVHNVTANGNNVIFLTYDPLGLNTNPDGDYGDNYYHWGYDEANHPFYVATQIFGIPTGVREIEDGTVPEQFVLKQNYPNPFGKSSATGNAVTTIEYSIPNSFSIVHSQLSIYDVLGRKIAALVNEEQTPGTYRVNFNSSKLPSGVYFYQLKAGNFVQSKKMMILK